MPGDVGGRTQPSCADARKSRSNSSWAQSNGAFGASERVRFGRDRTLVAEAGIPVNARAEAKAAGAVGDFPAVITCAFVSDRVHGVGEFLLTPPDPVGHDGARAPGRDGAGYDAHLSPPPVPCQAVAKSSVLAHGSRCRVCSRASRGWREADPDEECPVRDGFRQRITLPEFPHVGNSAGGMRSQFRWRSRIPLPPQLVYRKASGTYSLRTNERCTLKRLGNMASSFVCQLLKRSRHRISTDPKHLGIGLHAPDERQSPSGSPASSSRRSRTLCEQQSQAGHRQIEQRLLAVRRALEQTSRPRLLRHQHRSVGPLL
jgi:hypothetical protein